MLGTSKRPDFLIIGIDEEQNSQVNCTDRPDLQQIHKTTKQPPIKERHTQINQDMNRKGTPHSRL